MRWKTDGNASSLAVHRWSSVEHPGADKGNICTKSRLARYRIKYRRHLRRTSRAFTVFGVQTSSLLRTLVERIVGAFRSCHRWRFLDRKGDKGGYGLQVCDEGPRNLAEALVGQCDKDAVERQEVEHDALPYPAQSSDAEL